MRIFITADPELPVPPTFYGGIERVVALLVNGLHQAGHDVTLFASRESVVDCDLFPYPGHRSGSLRDTALNAGLVAREAARRRPDLVHSFARLAYLAPLLAFSVPKIMSYQRAVTSATVRRATRLSRGSLTFTGCSRRLIEPVEQAGHWDVVYNAVPVERFRYVGVVPEDAPLVFLGRVEHIKGTHLAIAVARRSGRRLVIAGNVPDAREHQQYFAEQIEPHLDGQDVTYVGPVDDEGKNALLGGAAALLMPVLWDEPFGIVMAEALACGTPVIGLNRGAVPEVVEHGVTGFVCADEDEMVEAVGRVGGLSRSEARAGAERRFSPAALVAGYEAVYAGAIARSRAGTERPGAQ